MKKLRPRAQETVTDDLQANRLGNGFLMAEGNAWRLEPKGNLLTARSTLSGEANGDDQRTEFVAIAGTGRLVAHGS